MDKTYIKMCNTDIIQGKWAKSEGDVYYCPSQQVLVEPDLDYHVTVPEGIYIVHDKSAYEYHKIADDIVWLPTQKQLQDMLHPFELPPDTESLGKECHNVAHALGRWIANKWSIAIRYETMEQLWLGFVMYHKHGLIWEDGEWVKEEKPELEEIDAKHLVWVNNKDFEKQEL